MIALFSVRAVLCLPLLLLYWVLCCACVCRAAPPSFPVKEGRPGPAAAATTSAQLLR